ncbi:MAG: hypothetical protein Q8S73_36855 [Deltaproteobacteria bacterium]|nr:hypothetical protein [Myxococcales bacterium]MDP3219730.1 hypothetical protein [Deltaproteobacteria bacterium]
MLTVADIARVLRRCAWVARQWCAHWLANQNDKRVPRVVLFKSGKRGRPSYRIDELSFYRWRRGLPAVADVAQAA